ncbi:MAG TPA: hypothetical protein VK970_19580 [Candidatus Methylacidiphilales bacterium]|nr:hypothetical protein [Candidatus Methylacidiphilales bacterium]
MRAECSLISFCNASVRISPIPGASVMLDKAEPYVIPPPERHLATLTAGGIRVGNLGPEAFATG